MKILDQLTNATHTLLVGVKNVIQYTGQFFAYCVTLGQAEFPRFKDDKHVNNNQASSQLADRAVAIDPRTKEATDFLAYLDQIEQGKGESFQRSQEYREYMNDTNPFSSIDAFYQKYNAKPFLQGLAVANREDFEKSPEYKSYLKNNPKNPFSETIQQVHEKYLGAIPARLRERMSEFNAELYDLFQYFEIMGEGLIKNSFIESPKYIESLNKMETDITYLLTLDNIKEAYNTFKDHIPEENKKFLDSVEDKHEFMASREYKNLNQKTLFVSEIKEAYSKFSARVEKERERTQFMENLKGDTKRFDKISNSKEYRDVIINPFHNLEELKTAISQFEKRQFIENLSESIRAEFTKSDEYKNVINNPLSTLNEFETFYGIWQGKREKSVRDDGVKFLEELKKQLRQERGNDDYYNKFIEFTESGENAYNYNLTREDMKTAFAEFQKTNPKTWGEFFLGH